MSAHDGIDSRALKFARVTASRFSPTTKNLELQTTGAAGDSDYGPIFGEWCLIAPPLPPTADAKGNISAAAEAFVLEFGDDSIPIATRDVRASESAQDAQGGEVILVNAFRSRIALLKEEISIIAGGGFIGMNIADKIISIVGMPSAPGKPAPYLSIDTKSAGLTSATGKASVCVSNDQTCLTGAAIVLDAGVVSVGSGASDPALGLSNLAPVVAAINAWVLALAAAASATVAVPPLVLSLTASKSVRIAR